MSLKIPAFVLGSNDKIPSFSRQIVADELSLEGNPRDFKDFQSSFGFPIFSLSFPITIFFFNLLSYVGLYSVTFYSFHYRCGIWTS